MHPEAYAFIARSVRALPLDGARVLEIGSYDVNGSVRPLFARAARYLGVDVRPGPGVDAVSDGSDVAEGAWDVVVSTEALEHDPAPARLIETAARALRPGGVLLLTCAGPGRAPHGCDGGALPSGEPYANVEPEALRAWLDDAGFGPAAVWHEPGPRDVYAMAWKAGDR